MSDSRPNPDSSGRSVTAVAGGDPRGRVAVDGRFFRLDGDRFWVKGVTYGTFAPDEQGSPYPDRQQAAADLDAVGRLGANVLRVYAVPPPWFLDLAGERGLRLLIDVPWHQQACFIGHEARCRAAEQAVRRAAEECVHHPATFALSVANEIPPDIVRWAGPRAIEDFLDRLAGIVKQADPDALCTFGNFPPTEFLAPREMDFLTFNLYLHRRTDFQNYLSRLQMLADVRPLVLGEIGLDVLQEGEAAQAETLSWQVESAFQGGAAGTVVFSFTDDWHRSGREVTDWAFGLTDRERRPRPAAAKVAAAFAAAPAVPGPNPPRVSVVVAAYNAARTLPACLDALTRLNYPDYEVVLVDDGSTDGTPEVAREFPMVRYFRLEENRGLSVARNTGVELATGEVVAFTDADCRPDADWLGYLVHDLRQGGFAGIGGHNLLPPDDSALAAAVMAAPGGPLQVMLDDRVAEHLPGCNMAFWREALLAVGGFDPSFRRAGDDVDLCWRMQAAGRVLGFSPGGFVWHYRRSTVRGYLRQQYGYGQAESLLERKHPERFNRFGGSRWRGRIYGGAQAGPVTRRPIIYHGRFGFAPFQTIYRSDPSWMLTMATSFEYYVLLVLPLAVAGSLFRWLLPVAGLAALVPVMASLGAALQVRLPERKRRVWSRPMVALLFLLQPVVRGWARYQGRLFLQQTPTRVRRDFRTLSELPSGPPPAELVFRAPAGRHRHHLIQSLAAAFERAGWQFRTDTGWNPWDLEVYGSRWAKLQLTTAAEYEPEGAAWIRCRLRAARPLPARLALWGLSALAVVLVGLNEQGGWLEWLWLLLPVGGAFFLRRESRRLRAEVAVFVRRVVENLGWPTSAPAGEERPPAPPGSPEAAPPPSSQPATSDRPA